MEAIVDADNLRKASYLRNTFQVRIAPIPAISFFSIGWRNGDRTGVFTRPTVGARCPLRSAKKILTADSRRGTVSRGATTFIVRIFGIR